MLEFLNIEVSVQPWLFLGFFAVGLLVMYLVIREDDHA